MSLNSLSWSKLRSGDSNVIIDFFNKLTASSTWLFLTKVSKSNLALASLNLINDSNCLTVILYALLLPALASLDLNAT